MYITRLPKDAVQIKNSYDYIDKKGNVYGIEARYRNPHKGEFFIKTQQKVFGYKYVGIKYLNKRTSKRVHRLVAEAFIPNPSNHPIVMHKNNKKDDNRVENLMWGTISQNTKQAFDDGLVKNDKGFEDSQSIPCDCYDCLTNKLIQSYGSVSEAERATGITKSGILFQIRNPDSPPKKKVYFTKWGSGAISHKIISMRNFVTDEEIKRFINIGAASRETNIPSSTISAQVNKAQKPTWTKDNVYFKYIEI